MENSGPKIIICVFLVVLACMIGVSTWLLSPGGTDGIRVLHDGKPVYNLGITVYATNTLSNGTPWKTGTTDGSGTFTFSITNGNVQSPSSILYDFNYNGTGYSFSGMDNHVITVNL